VDSPKFSVTLLFGEAAVNACYGLESTQDFDIEDLDLAEIEEGSSLRTRYFASQTELDAYLEGIEDAVGYLEALRVAELPDRVLERLAQVLAKNTAHRFSPEDWLRRVRGERSIDADPIETSGPDF